MATRAIEGTTSSLISAALLRLKNDFSASVRPILFDTTNETLEFYDRTAGVVRTLQDGRVFTETTSATRTLAASETGLTCFLSSATEFVTTLPAPAAGLTFRFIVAAAPSGASYTIVTNGSSNIIVGGAASADLNNASDVDFEATGCDTISLVDGVAVKGDWVEVVCDGTNWYARGFCSAQGGITFTTAS